jgi:hypothetical protein
MAWSIKQFPGQKEMLMKASFALPSIASRKYIPEKIQA